MKRTLEGPGGQAALGLRLAGGGLLLATGAIHLDLYLTGYRTIPTIGPLFLLQVIAAFALGLAVLATGSRLAAAAGAGFAVATLGGYLLSIWVGLFGFREIRTTAGIAAGVIEVAAFGVLAALALMPARPGSAAAGQRGGTLTDRLRAGLPGAGAAAAAAAGLAGLALVVLIATVATTGGSSGQASAGGSLRATTIGGVSVLTDAKGFTLYWFVPDTSTQSRCNGSCAGYWPPVPGHQSAGAGVTGQIGIIHRDDGSLQATYDGHPLYTYIGDSAPGQANGNNRNLNGGVWHEVLVSG